MRSLYLYWQRLLHSPFALQLILWSVVLTFITSFHPPYWYAAGPLDTVYFGDEDSSQFIIWQDGFLLNQTNYIPGIIPEMIFDEEGNVTERVFIPSREKELTYLVKSGENISSIAKKFNLRVSTVLWANNLTSRHTLQIGQEIKIPPVDGVYYQVRSGETLGHIAQLHDIPIQKIRIYNNISEDNLIQANAKLFLPNATKIYIAPPSVVTRGKPSGSLQAVGFKILRPARGTITQRYNNNHYAIDIGNKARTPIYAAAAGTVIKASSRGWNYGYGTYLIIDHGNDIQTVYAHNDTIKVSTGDQVYAGQLIALMGNTGNVFGPTGIHLHFELRIRGRKVNPQYYF